MSSNQALDLGEAIAALSMATDLANGHPLETSLRTGYVAHALARTLGLGDLACEHAAYAGILRYLGCTAYAHEEAKRFGGDDNQVRQLYNPVDMGSTAQKVKATVTGLATESDLLGRASAVAKALCAASSFKASQEAASCEAGERLAIRLGLPAVGTILRSAFERYDTAASRDPVVSILHVAQLCPLIYTGRDTLLASVRERSGGHFSPEVVEALCDSGEDVFEALEAPSVWDEVVGLDVLRRPVHSSVDQICQAFADFADVKSVYMLGASSAVARTARTAAKVAGMDTDAQDALWRAGLLNSIGRVSVPNGIWDKPGPLSDAEFERVRLYPYYTSRILKKSTALGPLADLAGAAQERADGSGYHRGLTNAQSSPSMALLAAASVFEALRAGRGHRPEFSLEDTARILGQEATAGRLDYDAVAAVCEAAGQERPPRPDYPANLSEREVDVLRLLATAHSNKEIGKKLFISAKTVQHHVAHIYEKADVGTRVGAALFAIENDLLRL